MVSVNIPDTVTVIGSGAFELCVSLTSVVIPDSVTEIGSFAFYCCDSLVSVEIGCGVAKAKMGNSPFSRCPSLTEFTVHPENTSYTAIDGSLYTKDGQSLVQYALGKTDVCFFVPEGVTKICQSAFATAPYVDQIVLPKSLTSLENAVFADCPNLVNVTVHHLNTSYKDIDGCLYDKNGKTLLYYPSGREDEIFIIPDGVQTINASLFLENEYLVCVVLPASLKTVGSLAFAYTSNITEVYYMGTATQWDNISFGSGNGVYTKLPRYYYSESEPTGAGDYWHYDEYGNVVIW
jgi:hypothetical protein